MCVGGIRRDDKAGNNPVWKVHQSRACKKRDINCKAVQKSPTFPLCDLFFARFEFQWFTNCPRMHGAKLGCIKVKELLKIF